MSKYNPPERIIHTVRERMDGAPKAYISAKK
jgi:hypothetical protein